MFSKTDRYSFSSGWLTWLSFPCPAGPTATRARVLAGRCDVASSRRSRPQSRSPREPERITRGSVVGQDVAFLLQLGERFAWLALKGGASAKEEHGALGAPEKAQRSLRTTGQESAPAPPPNATAAHGDIGEPRGPLRISARPINKAEGTRRSPF